MHPKPLSFFGVGFLRWFFRVFQRRDDDRLASLVAGYTYQKNMEVNKGNKTYVQHSLNIEVCS